MGLKLPTAISAHKVRLAIPWHLAQDTVLLVGSSWQEQNVDGAAAALQGEGPSVMPTLCAMWGKAEDRERLVAMGRDQGWG